MKIKTNAQVFAERGDAWSAPGYAHDAVKREIIRADGTVERELYFEGTEQGPNEWQRPAYVQPQVQRPVQSHDPRLSCRRTTRPYDPTYRPVGKRGVEVDRELAEGPVHTKAELAAMNARAEAERLRVQARLAKQDRDARRARKGLEARIAKWSAK